MECRAALFYEASVVIPVQTGIQVYSLDVTEKSDFDLDFDFDFDGKVF